MLVTPTVCTFVDGLLVFQLIDASTALDIVIGASIDEAF